MATQYQTAREVLTAHPHQVALPYRGDGVARALRQAYVADDDYIPPDMIMLLAAIDDPLVISDPG
jgi:hypothetical protein